MHENMTQTAKNCAPMIRYPNPRKITLAEFETPFLSQLDENNRWVKLSDCIPWVKGSVPVSPFSPFSPFLVS
jgi:hypothetical protein